MADMSALVSRLEAVAGRLESAMSSSGGAPAAASGGGDGGVACTDPKHQCWLCMIYCNGFLM